MKNILKASALLMIAGSMMGNSSCQQQAATPTGPKRRVQMGPMSAPQMGLPGGGTFDFQFVANQQLLDVLQTTGAFTTARVDPNMVYDTKGLTTAESDDFNQCTDPEEAAAAAALVNGVSAKSTFSQKASCMINLPQGIVSGALYDFTLSDSGGLTLGLAGIPFLTGGSFNFSSSELSMGMKALHPLIDGGNQTGKFVIATTEQQSYQKNWGASLGINFGPFTLGPSYYKASPLSGVVKDGLTRSINDLKDRWDKSEPWYAMVLKSCDKYIYINGGSASDVGLKVGDVVRIQNVNYEWEGKACESKLLSAIDYGIAGGAAPVAYARVTTVGNTVASAVILDKDPNYPYDGEQKIKPGARVYMEKLASAAAKTGTSGASASADPQR